MRLRRTLYAGLDQRDMAGTHWDRGESVTPTHPSYPPPTIMGPSLCPSGLQARAPVRHWRSLLALTSLALSRLLHKLQHNSKLKHLMMMPPHSLLQHATTMIYPPSCYHARMIIILVDGDNEHEDFRMLCRQLLTVLNRGVLYVMHVRIESSYYCDELCPATVPLTACEGGGLWYAPSCMRVCVLHRAGDG